MNSATRRPMLSKMLAALLAAFLFPVNPAMARQVGGSATNSSAGGTPDLICWGGTPGQRANETCVDNWGNLIPTTTGNQYLGTAGLLWKSIIVNTANFTQLSVGATYLNTAPPTNGAIVQGKVSLGTSSNKNQLDVAGAVAIGQYGAGTLSAPSNGLIVSGVVGLGTSVTVTNALDVQGAVAIGSGNHATTAPSNGLIVSGSVGLGTTQAVNPLDVQGAAAIGSGNHNTTMPSNGLLVSGNVSLGTISNTNALDVFGAVAIGQYGAGTQAAPSRGLLVSGPVGLGTAVVASGVQMALVGHLEVVTTGVTGPTLGSSNCNASNNPTTAVVVGSDNFGRITFGTGSLTACTMNFATAFTNPPACVFYTENSTQGLLNPIITATAVQFNTTIVSSSVKINYSCVGFR